MELVGQMYKLSACFDTPNEYKGLPYDYFPEDAVTYGSTICSFGLPYNDHNYGMPTGLTPPVMAPHLMDPVPKPKKLNIKHELTEPMVTKGALSPASSTSTTCRSSESTPRKAYFGEEGDYPVYVEPEIKVVEVPENLCVSASEYSDASSESSGEDTRVNPEFLFYLRSLASRHGSIERYLERAHRHYDQYAPSQRSSGGGSEKKEVADFVIDCVCEYNYDDRRMVQCESCGIKQHLDCMYANPRQIPNFLKHKCHNCSDIKVDIVRAKSIQSSRKNWHLTAQYSDKWHQRSNKIKTEDGKRHKDSGRTHDHKGESVGGDGTKGSIGNAGGGNGGGGNAHRVNKRKQDLKAYGGESVSVCATAVEEGTDKGEDDDDEDEDDDVKIRLEMVVTEDRKESGERHEEREESSMAVDPRAQLSDMYQEHNEDDEDENDDEYEENNDEDIKPRPAAPLATTTGTSTFNSMSDDYTERLALLSTRRRPQAFKKDYKEASRSLYTDLLLARVREASASGVGEAAGVIEGLDQGPEFLERNPRCRIVLFDGCTIGLEASVRLQSGSIVCALIGRMMLMEEYLKYTNPTTEHRQFVFLYHSFPEHGLVIDTSVYGNIVRYLRRSCDPNVKLEHTLISGNLYIVVRTTSDICQGVELTIPFDLPFEICQYPVQCACGKVRCPAVKHRRKHHRNRIITTSINCEQVIEDKLRELSQPLCGAPSPYSAPPKKASHHLTSLTTTRYPPYSHSRAISALLDTPQSHSHAHPAAMATHIKIEETEPVATDEHCMDSLSPPPCKQISSDLSGSAILTTKRRHKPVLHPDFEMDPSPARLAGGAGSGTRGSLPGTPVKSCTKNEPSLKRVRTVSGGRPGDDCEDSKEANRETSEFKSIITTRRQKLTKSPPVRKTEPIVVEEMSPRRRSRARK